MRASQHSWTEAPTNSLTRLSIARHTAGCFPVRADNGPIRGDEWSTCPLSVPLFHTNNTREYVQAAVEAGSHRFSLLYKPTISPWARHSATPVASSSSVFITNVSGQRVGRRRSPTCASTESAARRNAAMNIVGLHSPVS